MGSFVKLHGEILDSSVWGESHTTRIVWITLLAMANADGVVGASVTGLAHRARVTVDECRAALACFLGPDPDSRDGTTGERIEAVPGGWLILNHGNYREKQTREQQLTAARVAKHRAKQKETQGCVTPDDVTASNEQTRPSVSASASGTPSASVEADAGFAKFWLAYPRKAAKPAAQRAWKKLAPDAALVIAITEKAEAWGAAGIEEQFVPHPATWINTRRWEDTVPTASTARGNGTGKWAMPKSTPVGSYGAPGDDPVQAI